jgi:hypothetical protein
MKWRKTMFNGVIGIVIFSFAGGLLYKSNLKSKQGKCPPCKSGKTGETKNGQCSF